MDSSDDIFLAACGGVDDRDINLVEVLVGERGIVTFRAEIVGESVAQNADIFMYCRDVDIGDDGSRSGFERDVAIETNECNVMYGESVVRVRVE